MKNTFKESQLPDNFAHEKVEDVKKLVKSGNSFTVIGMPSLGISIFLRYITTKDWGEFIHIDTYQLPQLTTGEFFKLMLRELGVEKEAQSSNETVLLIKERLRELSDQFEKLILVFNRFDELKLEFDESFFSTLRMFHGVAPGRIVMIFSANKPYEQTAPGAMNGGNLSLLSQYYYLTPFNKNDLKLLILNRSPELTENEEELIKGINLSGGHLQLLQLLLKSQREDPLLDNYVRLVCKELFESLTYEEKNTVRRVAKKKRIKDISSYVVDVGMVKEENNTFTLFSPIFEEYILRYTEMKLPAKEAALFILLKKKIDDVTTKEEIFQTVWNNSTDATDWSLNALVYRLRKNPAFQNTGYTVENYKKVGYKLVKKD